MTAIGPAEGEPGNDRRAFPEPLRLPPAGPAYVELGAATPFSFLRSSDRAV